MNYQKENNLVLTGNAMITKPNYVITLCFQLEDGTRKGKSCDISITKNQLEILHSSLTTWLECMMTTPEEQAEAEAEIEKMMRDIRNENFKLTNQNGEYS
jgi:tRNA A-37 threonylcarbamoyl transferase component Bud32